jgi:multiple sugar transport system substrate-binding protein
MVATAQRFEELHPGVRIIWEKRSLKDFEEYPVEVLAKQYDFIVLDHPFMGFAARHGPLLPLDEHLPAAFLEEQQKQQVGLSHDSYFYEGHQWALAIDAAAPVAFWRQDLLDRHHLEVPRSWNALLELARQGRVEIPAAPIYSLMNFYTLCIAHGETPFVSEEKVVSTAAGIAAIQSLQELINACDPGCWERNPIHSQDLVSAANNTEVVYCPLAYGYSNYARDGYADRVLRFGEPPKFGDTPLRTTLGGTGLGLSSMRPSAHRETALAYAQYALAPEIQRGLLTHAGGQPGHRLAWLDPLNNQLTHRYLADTLPTLDRAFLRPRYLGYTRFQEEGGPVLHDGLRGKRSPESTLACLDALYRETLATA